MRVDIDKLLAAEQEASGDKPESKVADFRGRAWNLPEKNSFAMDELIAKIRLTEKQTKGRRPEPEEEVEAAGVMRLFIDELLDGQAKTFWGLDPHPTPVEVLAFANGAASIVYGVTPGESGASRSRSKSTTKSSRPRSKPPTDSN